MHETRGVRGTWMLLAGCLLILLSGCGVRTPGTNATNGTGGTGGTGGGGAAPQATIAVTPASLAFGNVALNTTATQPVSIASTGTASLQITALAVSGSGFALSPAPALPVSVASGATYIVNVVFAPTAAGDVTGGLSITSNASNTPTLNMGLSGSGIQRTYSVDLTWQVPSSSADPIAGFNVYRAVSGSGNFVQINGALVTSAAYSDTSTGPASWDYEIRSVDANGVLSAPSNVFTAVIP